MTRLNELTIDSPKAPSEPIVMAAKSGPRYRLASGSSVDVAGVRIPGDRGGDDDHEPSEMPVFWTTESIVIGRPVVGGAPWRGEPAAARRSPG